MAEREKGRRYKMSELEERVETWHRVVWKTSLKKWYLSTDLRKWGASCAGIKGGVLQAEGRAAWMHRLKDTAIPRSACGIRSHSSHDLDKHLEYRLTGPLNNMKSDRIGWGSQKNLTGWSNRLNGRIWNTTGMNLRGMLLMQNINSTALDEERHGNHTSKESSGVFHIRKADNTISIYFFFFKLSNFYFVLGWCWRIHLRVPWTSRRSNLKEINPEYSLKGLMLKLKLQYFAHEVRNGRNRGFRWLEKYE